MDYWNKYTETMPREELNKIELSYFKNMFTYAKSHAPMYADKLKGIDAAGIETFDDIKKIPFTYKEELRKWQEDVEPFPYGGVLGVNIEEVTSFRQTSGTTGRPVYVPESYESWQWRIESWCHILWMAGFRPRHRLFLPFGYNVYVAFWEAHYAAEKVGLEVVPGGALDTKGRVNKIIELKANALAGTPTYMLNIAQAAQEMGIDPKSFGIERIIGAGEPLPEATRKKIEATYGCKMYDHIGSTETCGFAGMCEEQSGLHIVEPFFLVESARPRDPFQRGGNRRAGGHRDQRAGQKILPCHALQYERRGRQGAGHLRMRQDFSKDDGDRRQGRRHQEGPGRALLSENGGTAHQIGVSRDRRV